MEYLHEGNRNILLLDGSDQLFTQNTYNIECPYCSSEEKYKISEIRGLEKLPDEVKKYIESKKIVTNIGGFPSIKKEVPAYSIHHCCINCNSTFYLIIGMSEIQPQRFKVFYKSKIFHKNKPGQVLT